MKKWSERLQENQIGVSTDLGKGSSKAVMRTKAGEANSELEVGKQRW